MIVQEIQNEIFDNSTCNIVSTMKGNKDFWGGNIGNNSIFFQEAINKHKLGGIIENDRKIY